MNDMVIGVATRQWVGWLDCLQSWRDTALSPHQVSVVAGKDIVPALQTIYAESTEPIIAYIHDDVMIYERYWDGRVLREFEDPTVGLVGFAGALGHGTPDLYTSSYHLPNLARQHFLSNMRTAEQHGARFTGECDVAVLDGLALFVRRAVLDKWGGWPVEKPYGFWMYSEALCCETRRQGLRIRLVGADVDHLGGKTSSVANVTDSYDNAHAYFYDHNRDVMPFDVRSV
jgi:hypothetical protein